VEVKGRLAVEQVLMLNDKDPAARVAGCAFESNGAEAKEVMPAKRS
jgi:hypothetical protein